MRSDLGFSAAQIRRFRASFCVLPNPDDPWPPDMIVQAGALLWGLLRSIANHGLPALDELSFHIYSVAAIAEVWPVLRRESPALRQSEAADIPPEDLLGLIVIRGRGGEPALVAAMYPGEYKVIDQSNPAEVIEP